MTYLNIQSLGYAAFAARGVLCTAQLSCLPLQGTVVVFNTD